MPNDEFGRFFDIELKDLQMTARRLQTFRKSDLLRAIKAAEAAGVPNPRFEIDRQGTISIVSGKGEGAGSRPGKVGQSEWDELLNNDHFPA